ncbi:MAG: DUF58 domain-containing protein [Verrucomicrobia bacterium]|nr:DUF58 domain-containing protein [Verrucomicrobiota bacterium]
MIPREVLKKIKQIELRTNRLVTESLAGQYHSVFKGQGMNFDEVREYQPGDEVRTIDWNVTARMNHPFVKKFVEERELTVMLIVDVSGSNLFGSGSQTKRELAAEIASVLAFSAIRNNDKVGLLLFSDRVEKFVPPRKGKRHVLRVIREIMVFQPEHRQTRVDEALQFLLRVTKHRSIAVLVSDFLQGNRRHDLVAVHIEDEREHELPALGYITLRDAETDEIIEINTGDARKRKGFVERRQKLQMQVLKTLLTAGVDSIQLRTGQSYAIPLARFFETRERRRLRS